MSLESARANRKRCEPQPFWWRMKARVAGGQKG